MFKLPAIFIWKKSMWYQFVLFTRRPPKLCNSNRRWKKTRTTPLFCNKQASDKWLKIYSHPTCGIKKTNTYKDQFIPQLHKPPVFNILNHMTKFKILYWLDTTSKSQKRVLESMKKKSHHLSDSHTHTFQHQIIFIMYFLMMLLTFPCRSAPLLKECSVFPDMVV